MEPRIFHGNMTPDGIARALQAYFNRGNYRAQQFGTGNHVVVQIATRDRPLSGGLTGMSVTLHRVEDGVAVQLGNQAWLGVAASLGQTALSTWRNPWNILNRLDDLAQDIESINLSDTVWEVIEEQARSTGASFELSERLRRITCPYCQTANPIGEANCIACGAPLGLVQPITCKNCGFIIKTNELTCPNCGKPLKGP